MLLKKKSSEIFEKFGTFQQLFAIKWICDTLYLLVLCTCIDWYLLVTLHQILIKTDHRSPKIF